MYFKHVSEKFTRYDEWPPSPRKHDNVSTKYRVVYSACFYLLFLAKRTTRNYLPRCSAFTHTTNDNLKASTAHLTARSRK